MGRVCAAALLLCVWSASTVTMTGAERAVTRSAPGTSAVLDAIAIPAGSTPVIIDGAFNEAIWNEATPVTEFVQREPSEGVPASHATEVRVAFDSGALYVAVQAVDDASHRIVGLLTRRDDSSPSDRIAVMIDSFHDRRTAFEFNVNAAGVKSDLYWYNDTNNDRSWDAVWDAAVSRRPDGWQAEFRIPFSQLRFKGDRIESLGFAVSRYIPHANETSTWPLLARSASGFVSSFGQLRGVSRSGPQKRLEVMPFVLGQVQTSQVTAGNPLEHSPNPGATVGLDVKYQVAPGLTLTGAVNPDFGQVEADPAVVNLGAFETFFSERRPFFVEGAGNLANELFYSRRIGRSPQRFAAAPDEGFADQPSETTILGAAKLTGKVGAFAIGALHAVTAPEQARLASGPTLAVTTTPVEPTTNYSVARVTREFADNSRLSVVGTSTVRSLPEELSFLPRSAFAGGVDGDWRLGKGDYSLSGRWFGSTVRGSSDAIARVQRSNVHSFQRPDATHLEFDDTRTSLGGHAGGVGFSKIGGTRTRGNVNAGFRSPGFEVNDLGFQSRADQGWLDSWFQVRDDVPGKWVLRRNINFNQWFGWTFGGDRRNLGGNLNSHWTFVNNWSIGSGFSVNAEGFDDRITRGGPGARVPGNMNGFVYLDTDNRKFLMVNLIYEWFRNDVGSRNWFSGAGVTIRPAAALSASLNLDVSRNINDSQWVTNLTEDDGTRYVFGRIDQRTVSVTARVNYTITPALTVQVYARPFISAGAYGGFRELTNGRADAYADRYAPFDYDGTPDFRVRSFRMTNVVRWEYRPGSAVFVVWQQGRQDFANRGDLRARSDISASLAAPADNTFLVKVSRWFDF